MNKCFLSTSTRGTTWKRHLHRTVRRQRASQSLSFVDTAIPSLQGCPDIQEFRHKALNPKRPYFFRCDAGSPTTQLPAFTTWFNNPTSHDTNSSFTPLKPTLVGNFQQWPFPYELVRPPGQENALSQFRDSLLASTNVTDQIMAGILQSAVEGTGQQFFQLFAPLKLLLKAIEYNATRDASTVDPLQLYIAQSDLADLPGPLQDDLPVPEIVQRAGRGDIYSSSVWLGTEPTYTPLHRDPNPNLFCQLYSQKTVRLLPPSLGDRLYFEVQVQIHQQGNSRIRTTDMMQGEERKALHDAVWDGGPDFPPEEMYEVELSAGDALFIPEGWWHSVKSVGADGKLNGSVNWWFR